MNLPLTILVLMVIMVLLDSVYIGFNFSFLSSMYKKVQGSPLQVNMVGAVLCYLFMAGLLYYFIVTPKKSVLDAFLLGIGVYGVYEFTSYATLKEWSPRMVVMDTLWGGVLFALATYIIMHINI